MTGEDEGRLQTVLPGPELLAKEWLLELIGRTPLREVEGLPLDWFAHEAPAMIGRILAEATASDRLPPTGQAAGPPLQADGLTRLRRPQSAPSELPRDIAALQSLLVSALSEQTRGGGEEFVRAVRRLTELFGDIQATVTDSLVRERSGEPRRDPLTGLAGGAELHERLAIVAANGTELPAPFTLLVVDVEGLGRINDAYGSLAGDRILLAVADVIKGLLRSNDRVFRIADDGFAMLIASRSASEVLPLAEHLRDTVARSQAADLPGVAVSIGVASFPEHGSEPTRMLESAQQATFVAKASGTGVAVFSEQ